jgi:hypothetical protein
MAYENWFEETRQTLKDNFGADSDLFARLLAATSPVTDMLNNVRLAGRAYRELNLDGAVSMHYIEVHRISIGKFLNDKPKFNGGRKIWSLYQNMIGNEQVCAIDRWMLRYFGHVGDRHVDDKLYDELEAKIKAMAFKNFLSPAQQQAKIWCEMRGFGATRGFYSYGQIMRSGQVTRENLLRRLI